MIISMKRINIKYFFCYYILFDYKPQNNIPIKIANLILDEIIKFDDETINKMANVILSRY